MATRPSYSRSRLSVDALRLLNLTTPLGEPMAARTAGSEPAMLCSLRPPLSLARGQGKQRRCRSGQVPSV
jgi:hypothetical protein